MPANGHELYVSLVLAAIVVEWRGRARAARPPARFYCVAGGMVRGGRGLRRRRSGMSAASDVTMDRRDVITSRITSPRVPTYMHDLLVDRSPLPLVSTQVPNGQGLAKF